MNPIRCARDFNLVLIEACCRNFFSDCRRRSPALAQAHGRLSCLWPELPERPRRRVPFPVIRSCQGPGIAERADRTATASINRRPSSRSYPGYAPIPTPPPCCRPPRLRKRLRKGASSRFVKLAGSARVPPRSEKPFRDFADMRALTRRLMLSTTAAGMALAAGHAQTSRRKTRRRPTLTGRPMAATLPIGATRRWTRSTASNFNQLQVAWQFKTENLGSRPEFILQCTPLLDQRAAVRHRRFAPRCGVPGPRQRRALLWMHRSPDEGLRAFKRAAPIVGTRRRLLERWRPGTHPLCHHRLSTGVAGCQDRHPRSQFRHGRHRRPEIE